MLTYAYLMVQNYLASLMDEEGQGMAEYGLILALVAIALLIGFTALSGGISGVLTRVTTAFGNP